MLMLSACSDDDSDSNKDRIRFGLNTAPVTLDPRYASDAVSDRICRLLYTSLIDFDEESKVIPKLAQWQQLSPTQYRFTLKQERSHFHNGSELSSRDVKATFDSILHDKKISPHRGAIKHIKTITILDDDTVDFILSKPDFLFPGRLNIGIMPAALIKADHPFHSRAVGNGPFQFHAWPHDGKLLVQRRSDHYLIEFLTVKDPTMRVLKLARGEIDLLQGNLDSELIEWLAGRETVHIEQGKGSVYSYLGFNLQDESLADIRVRQAIAHAIDRNIITETLFAGRARTAESLLTPEHWAGHPHLPHYTYDPERARQLLRSMGYDTNNPLILSYKTSNNPFRIRLATVIQYQLQKVGIALNIQSYDWGTFYGDIKKGEFQLYSLSWVGLNLPDIFRYVFHSDSIPPQGANRGRLFDTRLDTMIDEAAMLADRDEQQTLYHQIQEHIHTTLPYVSLWYEDNVLAVRKDIAAYKLNAAGNYDAMINIHRITQND